MVVVGGVLHGGAQINEATERYLQKVADAGVKLIGMCTGSFILCRAGLMKGRTACVTWYHYQDFRDEFPEQAVVADRLFVADGDRITCAGGAGTADLASYLIERHIGWSVAQKASQVLLFDRPRAGAMEVLVDHNIEKAMKILKRKLIKEGLFKELKSRRYYEKPSERRKRKHKESLKKLRKEEARAKKNTLLFS